MPSFAAVADDDRTIGHAAPLASSSASTVALLGVSALVLVVPFERLEPLLALPGQSLSSAEVVLLGAGLAWLTAVARSCTRPEWRTPLTLPWLALFSAMLIAAALAPAHRGNALNMAGRCGLAFGVYLLTVNGATSAVRLRVVMLVATAAGAVLAGLVVLEYLDVRAAVDWLGAFRERPAVVGTQLRAGGPFQYATIASMFLEILFALSLAWVPVALDRQRPWLAVAAMAAVLLIAEAIVLTFTRAGLGTLAVSLLVVSGLRWRERGFDRAVQALAVIGAAVVVLLVGSRPVESLTLRMTTEGMDAWFSATVEGPSRLDLKTGETVTVPVVVTNRGRSTWDPSPPNPFRFSYHWLRADQDLVVNWEGMRTEFSAPVPPGAQVAIEAQVRAPTQPGEYRLLWDVEHADRLWFSTEPGASLSIAAATVTGPPIGPAPSDGRPLPLDAVRPGRLALWGAAGQMLLERPITGIGPDNFRLLYGPYLNRPTFDTRVHTNSMYLEVLVGGGVLAGMALIWVCWRAAGLIREALGREGDRPLRAGIVAAAIAIAVHGLVDAFWGFTATYVLMAITLGLLTRVAAPLDTDAHRL